MRPWFVQMFDVALERRICCSRACSVSAKPGLPSRSVVRPTIRPGICRTCFCLQVMKPKYGPPDDSGTPSGWPSPQAMSAPSAPHCPGGLSSASDVGFTMPMSSAPCACAQSVSLSTSSSVPAKDGCCNTTATGSRPSGRRSKSTLPLAGSMASRSKLRPCGPGDGGRDLLVNRVDARRQQDAAASNAPVRTHGHQRGLGQRRRTVVERGVADIEPGQLGDHRLVLVNRLQRALAGLRLVGRIRAVELAARRDVPDRGRDVVLVGPGADETHRRAVHLRALAHQARYFHFAHRVGHVMQLVDHQLRRYLVEQIVDRIGADRLQHFARVFLGVRYEGHRCSQSSSSSMTA